MLFSILEKQHFSLLGQAIFFLPTESLLFLPLVSGSDVPGLCRSAPPPPPPASQGSCRLVTSFFQSFHPCLHFIPKCRRCHFPSSPKR